MTQPCEELDCHTAEGGQTVETKHDDFFWASRTIAEGEARGGPGGGWLCEEVGPITLLSKV